MDVRDTSRVVCAHRLLARTASAYPDALAIDFLGRTWTYRALSAAVDHVAAGLQAIGVCKGDRVGLCLPNTPFSVIGYYAVLKAGAIVVNFNPLYVGRELEHQIRDSGTSVMLTIDVADIHAKVAKACRRAGAGTIVLCALADALPRQGGGVPRDETQEDRQAARRWLSRRLRRTSRGGPFFRAGRDRRR